MMILFTLFLCGLIQAIFGIGLLAAGIPLLLMLGLSYSEALLSTLPSSLLISGYQILYSKSSKISKKLVRQLLFWALPFLAMSLFISLSLEQSEKFIMLTAGIVIISLQIINLRKKPYASAKRTLDSMPVAYISLASVIHGFTGQGGPALLYLSTIYGDRIDKIQFFVAYHYVLFSCVGLGFVFMFGVEFYYTNLLMQVITSISGAAIGTMIFNRMSDVRSFASLINFLLVILGGLLIKKAVFGP